MVVVDFLSCLGGESTADLVEACGSGMVISFVSCGFIVKDYRKKNWSNSLDSVNV